MKQKSTLENNGRPHNSYGIMKGFLDAFLGPKGRLDGIRRGFKARSWSTRLSFLLIFAAIISGFATYAALTEAPPFGDNPKTVIWLLNIDLIILLTLATLIARRVIVIWSGRKQNIAGSHLHVRLVLIFGVMAALPAIIMAVFSSFFFYFGVQTWFSENVKTAIKDSQIVAEAYLEEHQQLIKADTLAMAGDINRQNLFMFGSQEATEKVLDTQSLFRNLIEAMIFDESGEIIARSGLTFTLTFENVSDYLLERAKDGEVVVLTNESDDRVRALVRLDGVADNYLFVGRQVDASVLSHVASTREATDKYNQLEGQYAGLQITVTMIFLVVAMLLLMAAMWIGIVLARQLVTPISTLISASDRVRAGDLTTRIPDQTRIEEFDYLAQSFNRMTEQIQQQRNELITANRQLDQRRRLTETVLTGVPAGVVGVNKNMKITLANTMAGNLFDCDKNSLIGQNIASIVPDLEPLLRQAYEKPDKILQSELPFIMKDNNKLTFIIRIAIEFIGEAEQGAILTFDDITELQSAQRKAAWADVARRVAHEIKNPLTPIQLSAERLRQKYLTQITDDPETFDICTNTIIRHVADIGRMVNEFSDFARMPEANLTPHLIIAELRSLIIFEKAAHPEVSFDVAGNVAENSNFKILCDVQQIRQALTNLIQNALDSVQQNENQQGKIRIIFSNNDEENLWVIVTDNGIGLPDNEEASKLSDPYVTHKVKGTGLGLAIVKKIMNDHQGKLVIGNNKTITVMEDWNDLGGATVALKIPVGEWHEQNEDLKKSA